MLATCVHAGWDVDTTSTRSTALQVALRDFVETTVGAPVVHTAVDGCGAPA